MILGNEGWEDTPGAQMDSATTTRGGFREDISLPRTHVSPDVKRSRPGCTMPVRVSGRKPWMSPDLRGPRGTLRGLLDTQAPAGWHGACVTL